MTMNNNDNYQSSDAGPGVCVGGNMTEGIGEE